jgi:lysophospholipase L1-like esterase
VHTVIGAASTVAGIGALIIGWLVCAGLALALPLPVAASECGQIVPERFPAQAPRPLPSRRLVAQAYARLPWATERTVLLGDSIAAEWPADLREQWAGEAVLNLGVPGDSSRDLLLRVVQMGAITGRFDAALILIGTNDLRGRHPCHIAQDIAALTRHLKDSWRVPKVFVSTILPRRAAARRTINAIERVNVELNRVLLRLPGAYLVDLHATIRESCPDLGPCLLYRDGIHLSRLGYVSLSNVVSGYLQDSGKQRGP